MGPLGVPKRRYLPINTAAPTYQYGNTYLSTPCIIAVEQRFLSRSGGSLTLRKLADCHDENPLVLNTRMSTATLCTSGYTLHGVQICLLTRCAQVATHCTRYIYVYCHVVCKWLHTARGTDMSTATLCASGYTLHGVQICLLPRCAQEATHCTRYRYVYCRVVRKRLHTARGTDIVICIYRMFWKLLHRDNEAFNSIFTNFRFPLIHVPGLWLR
jgi:hypothetical protein